MPFTQAVSLGDGLFKSAAISKAGTALISRGCLFGIHSPLTEVRTSNLLCGRVCQGFQQSCGEISVVGSFLQHVPSIV